MSPLVSIIIPCYNAESYIAEAIESALAQTYTSCEVVVADDASSDGSWLLLESLASANSRLRVYPHMENRGSAATRNTAINGSSGEVILPLDADDLIDPKFVARTLPLLLSDERIGLVYTDTVCFGINQCNVVAGDFSLPRFLARPEFGCTALFRRADFDRVGGYCEELRYMEHWDFYLSLFQHGFTAKYLPEALFWYRHQLRKTKTSEVLSNSADHWAILIQRHHELFSAHWEQVLYYKEKRIADLYSDIERHVAWKEKAKSTIAYRTYRLWRSIREYVS